MIYRLLLAFLILPATSLFGQEIQCKVRVNFSQMGVNTSGDREIFAEIERAASEFMNNYKWTNDAFGSSEKIKCNLNINLLRSNGQYNYSGNAQFQVIRPVYGTTYETVLLNFIDRSFDFSFAPESRQMLFNEQTFTNNFTSMLAFYSLTALVVDYDSFSRFGGNPYIDRLFNIVNLAGIAVDGAWGSKADIRERYWVMENLRNQQFAGFREGFYNYHRLALDTITEKPEESKKIITDYLSNIQTLSALRPNATLINLFFDAKSEEIANIFSDSPKKDREAIFKLCSGISPDKTDVLRKLVQ